MTIANPQLLGGPQAPKTRAELDALIMRRDELREQLTSLNQRRSELADQVERLGPSAETRGAPLARLKEADARIDKLEAELNTANDLVTAGMARVGAANPDEAVTRVIVDEHRPPVEVYTNLGDTWRGGAGPELIPLLPITFGTVLLLGALMYWRISRSMKQQFARMMAAQSGRLDELQRSVDTVAVEVERVSENQRFVTKLVGERPAGSAVDRR